MVPVANRPLLEYVIKAVSDAGIEEIVLVVGYERERIQTHFGDGNDWDVSIRYVTQEKQLGTAHAVLQAEKHVDAPFLVLNRDRVVDSRIVADVRDALADGDEAAAMAVRRSGRPRSYGVVTVRDGRVETIVEKPGRDVESELINAGVYAFSPAVFDATRETDPAADGEYQLPATVERLIDEGGVLRCLVQQRWVVRVHVVDGERPCLVRVGRDERVGVDAHRVLHLERFVEVIQRVRRHPIGEPRRALIVVLVRLAGDPAVEPLREPALERAVGGGVEVRPAYPPASFTRFVSMTTAGGHSMPIT